MRRRLVWTLFPTHLGLALVSLLAFGVFAGLAFRAAHLEQLRDDLEARAGMLAHRLAEGPAMPDSAAIQRLCQGLGEPAGVRLTVVLPSGRVAGDSMDEPEAMELHGERPEIRAALAGETGSAVRLSATLGQRMLYVAAPVRHDGAVAGAVRAAVPLAWIEAHLAAHWRRLLTGSLAAAGMAALLALAVARHVAAPVRRLDRFADRFARGELEARIDPEGPEEIARLGGALNRMAQELEARMSAVVAQRNETEAVLASMGEGVLVVGEDERIRDCNRAAGVLLALDPATARGRPIGEAVRNSALQALVARTLEEARPGECDLVFRTPQERFIQARGMPLKNADGRVAGTVVVLNDVTRLKRLESLRRDFVGNVSHELKTPITSLRAASETLLDEAPPDPADARRFLDIIHRHALRLEAIVEDLLQLSRIEHDTERSGVPMERVPLRRPLEAVATACRTRAERRRVQIDLRIDGEPEGTVNEALIEQAVTNLVDNAIKFSPPGRAVRITASREATALRIAVEDEGPGIAPEHHARIFERFYCVDPGRSRRQGGTGLGLAIVKHIALAHGGSIRVESEPGRGSRFVLEIPSGEPAEE